MPAIVNFNVTGPGLFIEEIDTGGDNELDLVEIYSEWKDWAAQSDNLKHPPAFRQVGSDPITDIQNLGTTFFLNTGDGWRIRPAERDHLLQINGNLFTDPPGDNPIAATVGAYTVLVRMFVSNLVDASVARLDLTQLNPAVYIDTTFGVSGTDEGIGTPTNPVNNLADAYTIATRDKLREYRFRGSFTLDRNYQDWRFVGLGSEQTSVLDLGGYNVNGSKFEELTIEGSMLGRIEARECKLDVILGLDGVFRDCGLAANFSLADDSLTVFQRCFSEVAGVSTPVCSVGLNAQVNMRNYSGGIELQDVRAGAAVSVDLDFGTCVLHTSCTGGLVNIRGGTEYTDNSTGTTVAVSGLLQSKQLQELHTYAGLDPDNAVTHSPTQTVTADSSIDQTITVDEGTNTVTVDRN